MNRHYQPPDEQPTVALLRFDPEEHRDLMDGFEMTTEEKDAFLEMLWQILATFVDIGLGLDSVQLIEQQKSVRERTRLSDQESRDALTRFNEASAGLVTKEENT